MGQDGRPAPNIVLFVGDDVGLGDIQSMGGLVPTPNLDRLIAQGMNFTDAHTPTSSCHPTRFALVTGSNVYRTGRRYGFSEASGNGLFIDGKRWSTLGDTMKGAVDSSGESIYTTSFIGKMHLGLPPLGQHGYDDVWGLPTGGQRAVNLIVDADAQIITDNEGTPLSDGMFAGVAPVYEEHSILNSVLAQQAREFIESSTAAEQPFFLHFNSHSVHSPFVPPSTFTTYDGQEVPVTTATDLNGNRLNKVSASILMLDLQFGYLMDTLEAEGIADNTIVLFTSDNGAAFASPSLSPLMPNGHESAGYIRDSSGQLQPLRGAKLDVLEGGHRIPFIAKWGDGTAAGSVIEPGSTNDQLISTNDIMATLFDLTGQAVPEDQAMDSTSLLPTLFDPRQVVRREMYLQAASQPLENLATAWRMDDAEGEWVLLFEQTDPGRNDWYLLAEPEQLEAAQLYNLTDDPGQTNNLLSASIRINVDESPVDTDLATIGDEGLRERTRTMINSYFSYWERNDPRTTVPVDYSLIENQTVIPTIRGDYDGDRVRTVDDIDFLTSQIRAGSVDAWLDLNDDGSVDQQDRITWIEDLKRTWMGDANLDGRFSSDDLVAVFISGEYEDGVTANSTWAEGDWDGDGEFSTSDLVLAFQSGGYEQGRRPVDAPRAVPEPSSALLLLTAAIGIAATRRAS